MLPRLTMFVVGRSLRTRVLVLLLAVGLTPMAAIGTYLLVAERAAAIGAVSADLDLRAREGVVLLESRLAESRTAVEAVALNPVVRDPSESGHGWQEQLDSVSQLYPDFDDITIVTPDGRAAASTKFAFSGAWASKSWFREAAEGASVVSPPHMAGFPLHLVVVFAVPVRSSVDGAVTGMVAGQVSIEALARPLRAVRIVASDEHDHGGLCLLDGRGRVLAGPADVQPLEPGPPGIISSSPRTLSAMGSFWRTAEVPGLGWHVAAQVESAVIARETEQLAARFAVGAAAVTAFATMVAFVLSWRFSAAVASVSTVIDRIGDGHLDRRIRPFGLDEVDRLVSAFNGMATRLQETRAEVVRSEEWFRSLVVRGSDVVWVVDSEYRVAYVSPSAELVLHVDPGALIGAPFLELLPSTDRPRMQRLLRQATTEAATAEHGLRGISSDIVLESSVSDLTDVPAVAGLVIHTRDITDRKALEADVERAIELDRLKTEFVGLASHELRTPLTGIYGFSELLLSSQDLSETELGWVGAIHHEASRLREIIEDLLSVSRIEAGAFNVTLAPVPVRAAIEEALRSGLLLGGAHELVVNVEDDLAVWAQRRQLVEIVDNVVGNAVKYSPAGGAIEISALSDGETVRISVRDHGLGIPEAAIATLYDRFKRVDTPDRASIRGTGLGLYLVKRYVDAFRGTIEVESTIGVGTTVTVVLSNAATTSMAA